jgi:hypothetical protein
VGDPEGKIEALGEDNLDEDGTARIVYAEE